MYVHMNCWKGWNPVKENMNILVGENRVIAIFEYSEIFQVECGQRLVYKGKGGPVDDN